MERGETVSDCVLNPHHHYHHFWHASLGGVAPNVSRVDDREPHANRLTQGEALLDSPPSPQGGSYQDPGTGHSKEGEMPRVNNSFMEILLKPPLRSAHQCS